MKDIIVGNIYKSNRSGNFKIVEYINARKVLIEFEDGFRKYAAAKEVRNGSVKNPFYPVVCGRGFLGEASNFTEKEYNSWICMLHRCYDRTNLAYIDCEVDTKWFNFKDFLSFYRENYVEGFALDKDILRKGNKLYSDATCCFVPYEINSLFASRRNFRGSLPVGVTEHKVSGKITYRARICDGNAATKRKHLGCYKTPEEAFYTYKSFKEMRIKEVANKWKNHITEDVYNALLNWQIEITD